MNKTIHSITVNVFEKNKKNIDDIQTIYQSLLPLNFQKEKITITQEKLEGFHQTIIYSITLETTKNRHNQLLFNSLIEPLSKHDIHTLLEQIESRLNENGYFFIRLEKQALLHNIFTLTDDGDCFHIKIKIAGYPAKRSIFIDTIKSLLEPYKEKKRIKK